MTRRNVSGPSGRLVQPIANSRRPSNHQPFTIPNRTRRHVHFLNEQLGHDFLIPSLLDAGLVEKPGAAAVAFPTLVGHMLPPEGGLWANPMQLVVGVGLPRVPWITEFMEHKARPGRRKAIRQRRRGFLVGAVHRGILAIFRLAARVGAFIWVLAVGES
ncbi:hypothetical protein B0I37DRAFT_355499 [Chaetomium sp. MPI-CAGE-AT-0009]|nr:hypothetical protein B0I37DRAFT_355499 [Chaetomium sp. MPI-CAGE-AT-0009]